MESSDDDKPIAHLIAKSMNQAASAPALNIPKPIRTAPPASASAPVEKKRTSALSIDSDDDDVPLAVLMKRKLEASKKVPGTIPSKVIKTAPPPAKKLKVASSSKSSTQRVNNINKLKKKKDKKLKKSSKSVVLSSQGSRTSPHYESDKGRVVQAIMVRWWYAFQWPDLGSQNACPEGYEALNGFPGVFVGTRVRMSWYCMSV